MYTKRINCFSRYGMLSKSTVKFKPREDQEKVVDYVSKNIHNLKGIILYWSLGTGKTCTSIMILDTIFKNGWFKKAFILTPGSLRENYIYQYCVVCGKSSNLEHLTFITYNTRKIMLTTIEPKFYEDSVIVIDEYHNIINGYINQSTSFHELFETLKAVKNAFFILMSGTPIISKKSLDFSIELLHVKLPENKILEKKDNVYYIKNEYIQYIRPYISRNIIDETSEAFPALEIKLKQIILYTSMLNQVIESFKTENKQIAGLLSKEKKRELTENEKLSLFLYSNRLESLKMTLINYPYNYRLKDIPDKFKYTKETGTGSPNGWIPFTLFGDRLMDNLKSWSPKFYFFVNYILDHPGKHAIYCRFKKKYGSQFLSTILDKMQIPHRVFSGDLNDKQRAEIVTQYNSERNVDGKIIKVLIVTNAAAEGQNFFSTRSFHLSTEISNDFLVGQLIGRFMRFNSHILIKNKKERKLRVFKYFGASEKSVNTDFEDYRKLDLPDYRLYYIAITKKNKISGILEQLNKFSVIP